MTAVIAIGTRGIWRRRHLARFLQDWGEPVLLSQLPSDPARRPDYVLGWGLKPTSDAAQAAARSYGVPYLAMEDGFIRSYDLGVDGAEPLSAVIDDLGIYYDASRESRLERILARDHLDDPGLLADADALLEQLKRQQIGKYNADPPADRMDLEIGARPAVAVLDQTVGDSSVAGGFADAETFRRMLDAALAENPHAEVFVKTHPDVVAGKRKGYLLEDAARRKVRVLGQRVHWPSLCARIERVYVATSGAGLEALVQGVPVTCFGVPFFAGWGLTDDRAALPDRRGTPRSLRQLVAAAYLRYPVYVDPVRARRCPASTLVERIAAKRQRAYADTRPVYVAGMSRRKRTALQAFLGGRTKLQVRPAQRLAVAAARQRNGRAAIWSSKVSDALAEHCRRAGVELLRVEDGFLRSKGLGTDFVPASSFALDRHGIYYDPRQPSELERILATGPFDDALRARAAALRRLVVAAGVTKYNVGAPADLGAIEQARRAGRRIVLAPGQVPGDASLRWGAPPDLATDPELVRRVRAAEPDSFLVYKPHPDVCAGNRRGSADTRACREVADMTVVDAPITRLFELADAVHTMTSLAGFEALMRDKEVHTWGLPFYAGWGLTRDACSIERRAARLTIDDLVAGTLVLYPLYHDWGSDYPCEPEDVVQTLGSNGPAAPTRRTQLGILWRRTASLLTGTRA